MAPAGAAASGKHKRFGDEDEETKFMEGNLTEDISSFIKSLKFPGEAPVDLEGAKKPQQNAKKDTKKGKGVEEEPKAAKEKVAGKKKATQPTTSERTEPKPSPSTSKHTCWNADDSKDTKPASAALISAASSSSKPGKKQKFIIEPTPYWYQALPPLHPPMDTIPELSQPDIHTLHEKADALLRQEAERANANPDAVQQLGTSDKAFLSQILSGGTVMDKLSALTLMVQASPLHNQRALESLKTMAGKKAKDESLKALKAIVDLWVGGAAPERKLKYFVDQPLGHPAVTDRHLVVWAFEDWFKKYFFSLLQVLERLTLDNLSYIRSQAVGMVYTLLQDRPEQEQNLLKLLTNKLGDTDRTVSSKVSHLLLLLLQVHPSMKSILIREVSSLALRPTPPATSTTPGASTSVSSSTAVAAQHARYYAIVTFSQIPLSPKEQEVAQLLVTVYFELFVTILGNANDGVPELEQEDGNEKTEKASPAPPTTKRKPAKKSQSKGKSRTTNAFTEAEDSYSKLIAVILTGVNRALPYARMDDALFSKRIGVLARIVRTATFNVGLQALVLIQQIAQGRPNVLDTFYRLLYATLHDPRLSQSSKHAMYLNLLFKAAKNDDNLPRLCAFVKRFLQTLVGGFGGQGEASFVCGGLFLLGEIFTLRPQLRKWASVTERVDDSDEEADPPADPSSSSPSKEIYDGKHPDPRHANAERAPLWELVPLLSHFHPSVVLHASQLLSGNTVTADADLHLHSTSSFLDRFVSRKPKKVVAKGGSVMQPTALGDSGVLVRELRGTGAAMVDEGTLKHGSTGLPVDQLFFKKHYENKREKKVTKGKGGDDDADGLGLEEDDEEDEEDEAGDEDEVWKAIEESHPDAEALSDVDEDEDASAPSGLSDIGEDEGEEFDEDAFEDEFETNDVSDDEPGMDVDGFAEDSDDLLSLDGLGKDEEDEEDDWGGVGTKKRKPSKTQKGGRSTKRRKTLPTFASYEDYQKMIDEAEEENL
ncbi:hypothetical protein FRB99_005783 [Tulasnella sp. 403]|nr:hypothetical protein FRB99_005783 [Tulasnella sp. 403]